MNFMLKAWLVTQWDGETETRDLATVLFWMGSAPLAAMTVYTIGRYLLRWLFRQVEENTGSLKCSRTLLSSDRRPAPMYESNYHISPTIFLSPPSQ